MMPTGGGDCPHPGGPFVDVVITEEYGPEQRYQCMACGSMLHVQLGPFGPTGLMRCPDDGGEIRFK